MSPTGLVAGQSDPILLWHWCLGHPTLQKIRSIISIESSFSTLGCASCEMGKHHHIFFPCQVNNHSSSAFELVHYDVWGPSRVPSSKGFRYFLIFIDDFSHMTWLYLLKERSEVSGVIELFHNEIKTQFSSANISPVLGDGVVQATPSLNLKNVLYVSKFPVNLLPSAIYQTT